MDEGGGLVPWAQTMAILGTLKHRGIQTQWEALLAAHHSPWYAGDAVKKQCRKLAAEAAKAGGAEDARDRGSALHAIIAGINRGGSPHFVGNETLADLEAYCQTLEDYGVVVRPELVERSVVLDEWQIAGTPDGVADVLGHELPMVVDVKTGADPSYSWLPWSVQEAIYAHADALYTQGARPQDFTREPFPAVDQDVGLVIWLPAGSGRCELFTLDLRAGFEAFHLAMEVRAFRARKDLHAPFSRWAPPAPRLELVAEGPAPDAYDAHDAEAATLRADAPTKGHHGQWPLERRRWLQERINAIGAHGQGAPDALARAWPPGVAPIHKSDAQTDDELGAVLEVVWQIESRFVIPFGTTDPTTTTPTPRHQFPTTTNKKDPKP
jgi:hypothetical protein